MISEPETAEAAAITIDQPILLIDPGHGGADGGAVSADGQIESGINLDIASRLHSLCTFLGVPSRLTRDSEKLCYPPELQTLSAMKKWDTHARVELINRTENAVLLSIHQNFYPSPGPCGAQTFYAPTAGSAAFSGIVQKKLTETLCPGNRRLSSPAEESIYIMSHVTCPAVLVECGFLSNPEEAAKLTDSTYQIKLAAVLAASYLQYQEESYL